MRRFYVELCCRENNVAHKVRCYESRYFSWSRCLSPTPPRNLLRGSSCSSCMRQLYYLKLGNGMATIKGGLGSVAQSVRALA